VSSAKPSPKTTVKPSSQKPEKKMTMEERIRAWRQQHGKTIKVPRNTGTAKGNSNAQTMNRLAQDVEGLIGNGGSGDWGAGGVFDSYVPLLIEFIQREWKRVAPNDMGTKVIVPLYFEIDGRGNVLRSSIRKRSGIPVLDAAVEAMLRSMRRLPAPPDGKRQSFTVNLRVGELL